MKRKEFIKRSALATAGVYLGTMGISAKSYSRILGANDRVRIGVVGFSDRFKFSLLPAYLNHYKELNFDIVAVSDIWKIRREEGQSYLKEKFGHDITAYKNNDELYAGKGVDAVFISTSDFQHALHAIEAVKANCDAYVEKPFAETMDDNRAALKAIKESKKIIQIGSQRRSGSNYHAAAGFIQSGKFGPITMVELTWNVNQPGRWRRPELVARLKEEDTDWKRYLLDLPNEPFDARKYLEFRLFWPYSSGIPDQWLVHQIDTVHWFSGYPHPRSVVANGGNYLWHDGRKNWDTMTAVFDYGPLDDLSKGFQVQYSSRFTNSAGGVKELYYSNAGMIDMDKQTVTPTGGLTAKSAAEMKMQPNLLPSFALGEKGETVSTAADTKGDPQTSANMRNWMECVRSRKTPNASIEAGYSHSVALCMNVAAIQTGQKVTFDDKTQQVMVGGKVYA